MSTPMIGEIKMFAFDWAPKDYASCDGQTASIQQNMPLYALIGNTFGGDGTSTFCYPDLRGRTPIGEGSIDDGPHFHQFVLAQTRGVENVALTFDSTPVHTHVLSAQNSPTAPSPQPNPGEVLCSNTTAPANLVFSSSTSSLVQLNSDTCAKVGGGQSHTNIMPYTTINFCIALKGEFPQRN